MQVYRVIKTPIGVEVESSAEKGLSREPAKGADALAQSLSALLRAKWCIKGLCSRAPVRDVDETLGEIDAAIDAARASPAEGEVTTGEAVRRFACFTMEDGVYESATGEHVAYSDYESLARERNDGLNAAKFYVRTATSVRDAVVKQAARIEKAESENASLRAKLDERDADAERYRWLNERGRKWTFWMGRSHENGTTTWPVFAEQSLNKAVDAAIALDAARQSAQAASQPRNQENGESNAPPIVGK